MRNLIDNILEVEKTIKKYSNLIKKVIRETSPDICQFDMDDIEQEINIIIWKEFIKNEKKIYSPYSYIRRIAYTTTSRMMKTVSKRKLFIVEEQEREQEKLNLIGNIHSYGKQFSEEELMKIINEAIDSLVEARGKVIKMHLMGMHLNEIAEFLDWSEGKVRNLLYRGLKDLKEQLRKTGIEYNL